MKHSTGTIEIRGFIKPPISCGKVIDDEDALKVRKFIIRSNY